MNETTIFLSIFAIGMSLLTLWITAEVAKKVTAQTRETIQDHELSMMNMVAKHDELTKRLIADIRERKNEVFVLQRDLKNVVQQNKIEKARLNALIAEFEKSSEIPERKIAAIKSFSS